MGGVPKGEPGVLSASEVVEVESGAEGEVSEVPGHASAESQVAPTGEDSVLLELYYCLR